MTITTEFKKEVVKALLQNKENFTGSDAQFAKRWGINSSVFSRLRSGETDGVIKDTQFLNIGRELGVSLSNRKWNVARTKVFTLIEEDIDFCQQFSKSKILVDECGIGKTFTAKYLSKTRKNVFYIDASQAKTKQLFIRLFAKTLGIDFGRYADMKENIKYYLRSIPNPLVIIDEAGDLEYPAFLELKEFWNATENVCGWYLIGADGLKEKIARGITSKKVGYRELFSRYSEKYTTTVPNGKEQKVAFYRELIQQVLQANVDNPDMIDEILRKSIVQDSNGNIGGLRRAESLYIIMSNYENSKHNQPTN